MPNTREKLIELLEPTSLTKAYGEILATYLANNGVTVNEWIPVTERLPESGVHILAAVRMDGLFCNGSYVCDAFYAAKYTQSVSYCNEECACVYCEEDDEYYLEEGWYEVIKNWDDYNSIVISDTVTHWMPLPQPPKGE